MQTEQKYCAVDSLPLRDKKPWLLSFHLRGKQRPAVVPPQCLVLPSSSIPAYSSLAGEEVIGSEKQYTGLERSLARACHPMQAHPEDVNGGQCALCGQGEECGTDWISCDMCDCWVHFSCDKRPFLGELI